MGTFRDAPAKPTANLENRLYGLRHLSAYAGELSRFSQTDPAFMEQLVLLALMTRHGAERRSQLGQDVFALAMNDFKRDGYFVEVGAHNPEKLSNSYMLEQNFGWRGLLVEPNPGKLADLRTQRRATLIAKAAWNRSGEKLRFRAVTDSSLSALDVLPQTDLHDRSTFEAHEVETITLDDALTQNDAPRRIDFMSIDVEGAELQALAGLDFARWDIGCLSIEFNHDADRLSAYDRILFGAGYERVFDIISDFDAWYVKTPMPTAWRHGL